MNKLTLKQLQVFEAAVQFMSFTRAAKTMSLSKPAVTKQMQNLEANCGVPLFEQAGRRVRITEAGKLILPQVKTILEEIHNLENMLGSHLSKAQNIISISTGHTFSNIIFKLIQQFSSSYNTKFHISIDNNIEMLRKLEAGHVDFIVSTEKIKNPVFLCSLFQDIKFVLVASTSNALTKKQAVKQDDILQQTFIKLKKNKDIDTGLDKLKGKFNNIIQIDSFAAIKDAVKYDLGIGILPTTLIQDDLKAKTMAILPFDKLNYKKPLYLITEKRKPQPELLNTFISFITHSADAFI